MSAITISESINDENVLLYLKSSGAFQEKLAERKSKFFRTRSIEHLKKKRLIWRVLYLLSGPVMGLLLLHTLLCHFEFAEYSEYKEWESSSVRTETGFVPKLEYPQEDYASFAGFLLSAKHGVFPFIKYRDSYQGGWVLAYAVGGFIASLILALFTWPVRRYLFKTKIKKMESLLQADDVLDEIMRNDLLQSERAWVKKKLRTTVASVQGRWLKDPRKMLLYSSEKMESLSKQLNLLDEYVETRKFVPYWELVNDIGAKLTYLFEAIQETRSTNESLFSDARNFAENTELKDLIDSIQITPYPLADKLVEAAYAMGRHFKDVVERVESDFEFSSIGQQQRMIYQLKDISDSLSGIRSDLQEISVNIRNVAENTEAIAGANRSMLRAINGIRVEASRNLSDINYNIMMQRYS